MRAVGEEHDTLQTPTQFGRKLPKATPWLLLGAAALAFVAIGVLHTGFVRDDWTHYYNMRLLHDMSFMEASGRLATNDWFGAHELRIFFGSFLTHYFIAPLGSAASSVAYTVILSMHAGTALLTALVVQRLSRQQVVGIACGVLLLLLPVTTAQALWINNLFFVQPLFLLALLMTVATTPSLSWGLRSVLMTPLALACQFSGEATIPVLCATLCIWVGASFRRHGRAGLWSLLPLVVTAVALGAYLGVIVTRPAGRGIQLPSVGALQEYFTNLLALASELLNLKSDAYGTGGLGVSAMGIVVVLVIAGLLAGAILSARTSDVSDGLMVPVVLSLILLIASTAPMVVGMATGDRPTPDYRYLYVSATIATVLIVLVGGGVLRALSVPAIGFQAVVVLVATYFTAVSVHNIVDVWGLQRSIDAKIWSEMGPSLQEGIDVLVTYHPDHQYPMSPNASNAVSDFQADWGLNGRRQWETDGRAWRPIFQDARMLEDGTIATLDYYSGQVTCLPAGSRVLYLSLDYGSRFEGIIDDPLLVTQNYQAFTEFRENMRPYADVAKPWPESYCSTSA